MFDRSLEQKILQSRLRREAFEQAEAERLDEEVRLLKDQTESDFRVQQAQIEKIQNAGFIYRMMYRIYSLVGKALTIFHNSVGMVASVLPPVNAVIAGMLTIIELIEIIFISKETLNRRAVKAMNSFISMGLSIAALVLALNPATAPFGVVLVTASIAVSTVVEGYFWYKASKDVALEKTKKVLLKEEIEYAIHEHLHYNHQEDIQTIKAMNAQISELKGYSLVDSSAKISALKKQKDLLVQKIDLSVNQSIRVLSLRNTMQRLNVVIKEKQQVRNDARRSFFYNLVSFAGMGLLAVSSLLVAAAVLSNPVGLALAGVALLGIVTVAGIKNRVFPAKSIAAKVVPVSDIPPQQVYHEHISDTETIVNKLALRSATTKKKILENDVNFYKSLAPVTENAITVTNGAEVASDNSFVHTANALPKNDTKVQDKEEDRKSLPH